MIFYIYQLFTEDAGLAIKSWPRAKHREVSEKDYFYKQDFKGQFLSINITFLSYMLTDI